MPEPAPQFPAYAVRFQDEALRARQGLPPKAQLELLGIVNDLSDDPNRFSILAMPLSRAGDLFLYVHPNPPLEITYRVDARQHVITLVDVATRAIAGVLVVISYSHADRKWLSEVKKFLKPLVQQHKIRVWDDSAIEVGAVWREAIARFFGAASVAIFLVSQDFIASDFITQHELPPLLARGKAHGVRLLWIAVRPSTYTDLDLSDLQALNDPDRPLSSRRKAERERDLTEIRSRIVRAVEQVSTSGL
jgi:hypothetical protein